MIDEEERRFRRERERDSKRKREGETERKRGKKGKVLAESVNS